MTTEERITSLEQRVAQAETDIKNLAEVLGKFAEGVASMNRTQREMLVVMSNILPKREQGRIQ